MQRPNILLITTDQQHFRMMRCAGGLDVDTPNLDRLAASGMRFERAYSPNPVCVACRYSFMTGRMPHVFGGLETNLKNTSGPRPRIRDYTGTPCIGHLIRSAGYDTVCGGKLHVEDRYHYSPEDEPTYGFRCLTGDDGDGLASACADYLNAPHDVPFFLWASFEQPHKICGYLDPKGNPRRAHDAPLAPLPENFAPTTGEGRWIKAFREGTLGDENTFELGLNRAYGRAASGFDDEAWRRYRGAYRKWNAEADRQIGVVLDALETSGHQDSTVVIFTSDHGDHDGAHGLTMKRSFYEESVHIPLIMSSPGRIPAGSVDERHLICNGLDLLPTLCDYAGVSLPSAMPGASLRPLAEGRTTNDWRSWVISQTVGGRMVRTDRYKYCLYCCDGIAEELLFDMDEDPGEAVNIAGQEPYRQTLADSRAILTQWVKSERDIKGAGYLSLLPVRE